VHVILLCRSLTVHGEDYIHYKQLCKTFEDNFCVKLINIMLYIYMEIVKIFLNADGKINQLSKRFYLLLFICKIGLGLQ
jgi:hypothetical protein